MARFRISRSIGVSSNAAVNVMIFVLLAVAVQSAAAPPEVHYKSKQGIGFARAMCGKLVVTGGGAFVENASAAAPFQALSLRQTHPISDKTGVNAFGSTAIGWQAASSDFQNTVASFAICAAPSFSSSFTVEYVSQQGTGVARAFCPANAVVLGGGGFVETPAAVGAFQEEKLRQSHPISDATGVIAFGTTAIGWQAASSNFEDDVVAFAVCATPTIAGSLVAHYESAQSVGVARAFCQGNSFLTGGGGFVELTPNDPFRAIALRQTYPISDPTGVIAHGTTAIGWQAASSDFNDVVASFAICVDR